MTFSVLTVSKRTGWEKDALKSLKRQTVWPFTWIVISENWEKTHATPWTFHAPESTTPSNLNKSINAGLKLIDTDYVIFYQDFIELSEDCFEKLLSLADGRTFVTTCTPNYDGSDDSRYMGSDCPRTCSPEEWETNVALAPMKMLRELGGFPEHYDEGWSWDNVNVAQRAAMIGARFIIDESNRPKLLPHELTSKLTMELNLDRHNKEMDAIRSGQKSLYYDYL